MKYLRGVRRTENATNRRLQEISQLLKPLPLGRLPAKPLVSLLTPNYNYVRYLGEAIESAFAQTYSNFEMIVCDDGSTDSSCEVIEQYARRDARIKLVRKENGGVASALNAAYRESTGEIICLLDADDRYLPEKLEKVVEAFQSQPDSGLLGHRLFHIDAAGRRLGVTCMFAESPSGWYGPFVACHGDIPPGLFLGSGLCLRRDIADLVFPLPEKFRTLLDVVIMAQASLMTPIIGLPLILGEYRYHANNITNTAAITAESLDRAVQNDRMMWELRRGYLARVHPRLAELFPGCDQQWATLLSKYIQARLQTSGGISAYRKLVRAECFGRIPSATKCFWRLSILLPNPLFRRAVKLAQRPSRLKKLIWKAREGMAHFGIGSRRSQYSPST